MVADLVPLFLVRNQKHLSVRPRGIELPDSTARIIEEEKERRIRPQQIRAIPRYHGTEALARREITVSIFHNYHWSELPYGFLQAPKNRFLVSFDVYLDEVDPLQSERGNRLVTLHDRHSAFKPISSLVIFYERPNSLVVTRRSVVRDIVRSVSQTEHVEVNVAD